MRICTYIYIYTDMSRDSFGACQMKNAVKAIRGFRCAAATGTSPGGIAGDFVWLSIGLPASVGFR